MTWLRLDDKFGHHPKVQGLSDRAFRLHVLGLCFAAEHNTDGFMAQRWLPMLGLSRAQTTAKALVLAELWEPIEGGWLLHDFLHYNPTKEQVDRQKSLNRGRQARYRASQQETHNETRNGDALVTAPRPVPSISSFTVVSRGAVETESKDEEATPVAPFEVVTAHISQARELLTKANAHRPDNEGTSPNEQ